VTDFFILITKNGCEFSINAVNLFWWIKRFLKTIAESIPLLKYPTLMYFVLLIFEENLIQNIFHTLKKC